MPTVCNQQQVLYLGPWSLSLTTFCRCQRSMPALTHRNMQRCHHLQVPLALFILLDPYYNQSTIWARDDFSTLVMAVSAGYFLYDTIECMIRIKHEGFDFLLHGIFCFIVFTNLAYTGYFHFYGKPTSVSHVKQGSTCAPSQISTNLPVATGWNRQQQSVGCCLLWLV